MQQKCALCPAAAVFYCVNDDAHLCASCDVSVHTGNPLLARHERRSLTACHTECASAAHTTSCSADDVAVVPQFAQPASVQQPAAVELEEEPVAAALLAGPAPAPANGVAAPGFDAPARDFAADLLDIDLPLLDFDFKELEATERDSFSDCVVPSAFDPAPSTNPAFTNFPPVPASLPILHQHAAAAPAPTAPLLHRAHSSTMVPVAPSLTYSAQPSGFSSYTSGYSYAPSTHHMVPTAVVPQAQPQRRPAMAYTSAIMPTAASAAAASSEEEAREERVRRHRQQKRAKRNLGRTVRYQSRKAYAMIRPRIKGRFVSPEEWEAHLAAQSGPSPQTSDNEVSEAIVPAVY